ncbi:MAG: hypothetical protein WCS70_08940 [Verrucomicrobiota bacterium]
MFDDPIVAEVRRVRDELSRKFNYDVHAIFEDLRKRQGKTVTGDELRAGVGAVSPVMYPSETAQPAEVRERKE